jgi:hypothetical protein
MLSAVPVQRILEGIAESLRNHVQPHVKDKFSLMQLRAIDELLRNLAGRLEWSLSELKQEIKADEELLAQLITCGWDDDKAHPQSLKSELHTGEEALEYRALLLTRIADAMIWIQTKASPEAQMIAVEYLRETNDRERKKLKSGMYS